jgi:hypothetical protein
MTRTVQTTTLLVSRPVDFSLLEQKYKLVRYVLPDNFRYREHKDKSLYGKMHNALRDQLNCPYKTFKYDKLEKGITRWVVYALYPREAEVQSVTIPFLSEIPLSRSDIPFASLDLHVLLKLLHIAYFRGDNNELAGRFIGQDRCYVYAKDDREKGVRVCLEIEIKGDIRNQQEQDMQEFKVVGHARPFRRVTSVENLSYAYFGSKERDGKRYFIHLKRSEIEHVPLAKEPIYVIRPQDKQRTTLAFHDQQHIEACVGKILHDFIRDFRAYLAQYGIVCTSKERTFTELVSPKHQTHLPLSRLGMAYVYDNRLNQQKYSLQQCLDLFSLLVPDVHFTPITHLSSAGDRPVLVVQDHNREDFEEEGILQDRDDPYDALYQTFSHLPKQSISINQVEREGHTADEYLDYTLPQASDEVFKQKLEVALLQLYLKDVILHERSVEDSLPLAPTSYIFIRKDRYYSRTYETLLYFQDDRLHFLDLRDPGTVDQRNKLLNRLGINWEEMYNRMLLKYRKNQEDGEKQLSGYDVIIGPGIFAELEDLDERILYNYDEILARQNAVGTDIPINDLKLTQYYDRVRNADNLPHSVLQSRGLLDGRKLSPNAVEKASVELYQKLIKYDAFLDDVARTRVVISFNDLTEGELWERIIRIFGYKPGKKGRLTRAPFKAMYQKLGWFSSDKAKELHLYQGIWYDEDNCYMVGSVQSMKLQQPRAHLIRRFDVYEGRDKFDIYPLLLTMSVQFVRHKQYTVYPYPFHLIDLYVENVLRFQ